MNEISISIFQRMLLLTQQYRSKSISLRRLVDTLEGSIDAIEEKVEQPLFSLWYMHWGNLEIVLASGMESENQDYLVMKLKI